MVIRQSPRDLYHLPRLSLYTSPDQSPGAKHLAKAQQAQKLTFASSL